MSEAEVPEELLTVYRGDYALPGGLPLVIVEVEAGVGRYKEEISGRYVLIAERSGEIIRQQLFRLTGDYQGAISEADCTPATVLELVRASAESELNVLLTAVSAGPTPWSRLGGC